MAKRTKKTRREVYKPSSAAENVARAAATFDESYYVWEAVAQAADSEYSELVRTAEEAAAYLEEVPDADARILVRLLRDALIKATPPKDLDEQPEQQLHPPRDPTTEEREAAIGYLAVCMNAEFAKMVLGLNEDKTDLAHDDKSITFDRLKEGLRKVGFRWTDDYFEKQLRKLIEEAAQRRQALDEASKQEEIP